MLQAGLGADGHERHIGYHVGIDQVAGCAEPGEVALLDDLPHAGSQRLGEDARVDAAPDQDDARGRPGDPQHVGQRGGCLEVDAGTEHHGVLVR